MNHTLSPATHTIHLTTSVIDAGQIISLARELDATECKGRRAALSLLRMKKLQEEADLREQVKREKEALKARYNKRPADAYRDWLHAQAEAGREAALEELRRMRVEPFPASKPDDAAIRGEPQRAPLYQNLQHVVHRNGDVTYMRGQEAILRDTARAVNVIQTDHDTIEAGLRLAMSKFGPRLELTGSDEFKRTTARIAAQAGLKVEFDDPALNEIVQKERAAIEQQRQFVPQTRAKIIQRADGPAIDQRRQEQPVAVERRKDRVAQKIREEEAEKAVDAPVEKPKAPRMR